MEFPTCYLYGLDNMEMVIKPVSALHAILTPQDLTQGAGCRLSMQAATYIRTYQLITNFLTVNTKHISLFYSAYLQFKSNYQYE